jgi:hypothetical protein
LHDRIPIADVVNAQVISLEEAPKGYADFDRGAPAKFILDPHGTVAKERPDTQCVSPERKHKTALHE